MYLETNLLIIKQVAAERERVNFCFRSYLKDKDDKKVESI
jgi:hypothetical protein